MLVCVDHEQSLDSPKVYPKRGPESDQALLVYGSSLEATKSRARMLVVETGKQALDELLHCEWLIGRRAMRILACA